MFDKSSKSAFIQQNLLLIILKFIMDVSIPRVSRVSPMVWSAPGWVLPMVGYADGCRVGYYMPMILPYNAKY